MVFSYGFLENSVEDARQLFLPIDIPDDDLLKQAKKRISGEKTAPGLRLAVENGKTVWESDFIFWGCVNEEDGLSIEMIQPVEGPVELKALWKGEIEIGQVIPGLPPNSNLRELRTILSQDPLWDLFQLRAAVLVQQCLQSRVEMLGGEMEMAFESVEHDADGSQTGVRSAVYEMIRKLRLGETALLQWGLKDLANEVRHHIKYLSYSSRRLTSLTTDRPVDGFASSPGVSQAAATTGRRRLFVNTYDSKPERLYDVV